jgi:hypothetical protein
VVDTRQMIPRLPALYEEEKRLVGIDGPCKEILQWLMEGGNDSARTKLKAFKCTRHLCGPVSKNPDLQKVLRNILSGIGYTFRVQTLKLTF